MDNFEVAISRGIEEFSAKYELDSSILSELSQILLDSLRKHVKQTAAKAAVSVKEKKPRRKTGYNFFIQAQFEEAKKALVDSTETKPNSQEQMACFSKQWKELSDEQKQPYNDMADNVNKEHGVETSTKSKSTGKRGMTGYNLFYKEQRDIIRNSKEEGTALMVAVGAAWKALTDEEKAEYKSRAKDLPEKAESD